MMATSKIPSGWVRDPHSKALVMTDTESVDERVARLEAMVADVKRRIDLLENREVTA